MRDRSGEMKTKHPASYKDVLAAPENKVAELIGRTLYLSARPAGPHASVHSQLLGALGAKFGGGGAGGWWIITEPELHLGGPVLVPDIAGWKRRRMPQVPADHKFTIVPDWVCEIASPSTATYDRERKRPIYAEAGIKYFWWIEPLSRLIEVYRSVNKRWTLVETFAGNKRVRAEPFDEVVIDLSRLWAGIPKKALEPYTPYWAR